MLDILIYWYSNKWARQFGHSFLIVAAYCASVYSIAYFGLPPSHRQQRDLTQKIRNEHANIGGGTDEHVPALARWDSFWYHAIATRGYDEPEGHRVPAGLIRRRFGFLPLSPYLMHSVSTITGCDTYVAGLVVSACCLLGTVLLLRVRSPDAIPLLLAFPASFVLVTVYSESLFLFLVVLTFHLSDKRYYLLSAFAALLAGLTRVNGLALIPAMLILPLKERRLDTILPLLGAITGQILLAFFFLQKNGDPLAYIHAKDAEWGARLTLPWYTLCNTLDRTLASVQNPSLGSLYTCLEIPLLIVVAIGTVELGLRKRWIECTYVVGSVTLSLISGSTWGLPRFVVFLFPLFTLLSERRIPYPAWLWLLMTTSAMVQGLLTLNFVRFGAPAP